MRTTESSTSRGDDHHQVGQLVDDHHEIGVRRQLALAARRHRDLARAHRLVEVVDVTEAEVGEVVVAHVHLAHDPCQRLGGLLGAGDDRRDQVRDAFVGVQLDPLGVDHDHPHLVGRGAHQQRRDHRVDEAGLAGAGGAGDQQVRHLRQVGDHEAALDVLAEPDHQRVVVGAGRAGPEHVAERHDLLVQVGDLDADGGLAGDRRQDPDVGRRDGVRDVLRQRRDLLDLDGRADLDLVPRHGRSPGVPGDLRVDAELLHHLGEPLDDRVAGLGPGLVRASPRAARRCPAGCRRCRPTARAARRAAAAACAGAARARRRTPRRPRR